jgi:ABC-2 type transport system permease protein
MSMIRTELFKLMRLKAFWICLLIAVVVGVLLPLSAKAGLNVVESEPSFFGSVTLTIGAIDVLYFSMNNPLVTVLMAIVISIFVSSEFSHGTMKNFVSKGGNRTRIYLSKLVVCFIVTVAIAAGYVIAILVCGTAILGFDSAGTFDADVFARVIGGGLFCLLAYAALFVMVGMNLRSSGGAVALNLCLITILSMLLSIVDYLLDIGIKLSDYWLASALSTLTITSSASSDITQAFVVSAVWLVASTAVGIALFHARDIK